MRKVPRRNREGLAAAVTSSFMNSLYFCSVQNKRTFLLKMATRFSFLYSGSLILVSLFFLTTLPARSRSPASLAPAILAPTELLAHQIPRRFPRRERHESFVSFGSASAAADRINTALVRLRKRYFLPPLFFLFLYFFLFFKLHFSSIDTVN